MNIKLKQVEKKRQSSGVIGTEVCDKRMVMDIATFQKAGGLLVTVKGVQHLALPSQIKEDGTISEKDLDLVFGVLLTESELCDDNSVPVGWYLLLTANEMMNSVRLRGSVSNKTGTCTSVVMNDAQVVNLVTQCALRDNKFSEMNLSGLEAKENISKDLVARGVYHTSTQSKYRYLCELSDPITFQEEDVTYTIHRITYNGLSTKKDIRVKNDKVNQ